MRKLGIVILVLVLALGALGAGYAAWSQTLDISGTADVATFDVAMYDNGTATYPAGSTLVTNFGTLESYNQAGPESSTHGGGVSVTITDAVPGTYNIPLKIENNSSIPLNLSVGTISANGGILPPQGSDTGAWTISQPFSDGSLDANGGTQYGNLQLIVPDDTPQGASYSFLYSISAAPYSP